MAQRTFLRLNGLSTFQIAVACRRAFRPPTTPLRFFALQRWQTSRSTFFAGFACPLGPPSGFGHPHGGFLPAHPCRPYFRPAALLGFTLQRLLTLAVERHSCRSAPTWWFRTRPLVRASTPRRRVLPPLGFAPQECPSPDCRCYPVAKLAPLLGFFLFEACPSAGVICSSANFRPLACSPTSYPVKPELPLGVFTAGRPS